MKIGIDFGTSYTKIAYPTKEGPPFLFRHRGTGLDYIATAIAYKQRMGRSEIWLGDDAVRYAGEPNVEFYKDFKMRLPITDTHELIADGWSGSRTPQEVTIDYLLHLLRSDPHSFEKSIGSISKVIVSVPELWYRDINNPGPNILLNVLSNVGLDVERLQSEPVCAAACYAYLYSKSDEGKNHLQYNLLVCDVGGGTFDVALCQVASSSITVLAYDGSGQRGLNAAGAAFDRACSISAYCSNKGEKPQEDSSEFIQLLNNFEKEKIANYPAAEAIRDYPELPNLADSIVYDFSGYGISVSQAYQAFKPIQEGIEGVLDNILNVCREKDWLIDRLLIVGGFGQYPLVTSAIFEKLSIKHGDPRIDSFFNYANRFYAIAFGAYYLVNGEIEAIEPYPHSLGVCTKIRSGGKLINSNLSVIDAGQSKAGMLHPEFAIGSDGLPEVVTVEKNNNDNLPIYIQPNGIGEYYTPASIHSLKYPPPGRYKIGFQIDRSNLLTLFFVNVDTNEQIEYSMGQLDLVKLEEVKT